MMKSLALAGALAAGLMAGTALTSAAEAQTLTLGVRAGPESIDPHWSTLGSHAEALRHIFDTLVGVDENLQLEPALATSWTPVDDTTWEFKIREGVKFHDGTELTAHDVKFSIERIPVVTGPMSMTIYTKRVAEAIVVDDYTLHVKTNGPAPTLPNDFIRLFVVQDDIGMDPRNEEFNSGEAAIGTGPYRLVSWEPKGDLVMERFEEYWGEAPHWETVVRKEIPNDPARVAALKSGQVDMINYVPGRDYARCAVRGVRSLETFLGGQASYSRIYFQLRARLPIRCGLLAAGIDENHSGRPRFAEASTSPSTRRSGLVAACVLEGLGRRYSA